MEGNEIIALGFINSTCFLNLQAPQGGLLQILFALATFVS